MSRIQRILNRLFKFQDLSPLQDRSYLLRWTLLDLGKGRRIYLHKVLASDWSREPHDHPKDFISIGLKGNYIEERYAVIGEGDNRTLVFESEEEFRAPWIRRFNTDVIHRIRSSGTPTWTLVYTGPYTTDWGFYRADGSRVGHAEYIEEATDEVIHSTRSTG